MRILAISLVYPPYVNNGSISLHHFLKFLKSKGHEIKVINPSIEIGQSYSYEGLNIGGKPSSDALYTWCDIMITQLYATNNATALANKYHKPIVHLLHSNEIASYTSVLNGAPGRNYIVYNSRNVKEILNYKFPSIICNPPIIESDYNTNQNPIFNQYVTLISLNDNKGARVFYELAKRMPDYQFLGVKGIGSYQIIEHLPNVTIMENTINMKEVYGKTRILLMPSEYESWGRTANEAMINGIPVVCSNADGLKENCSYAGIYVDRNYIDGWERAIRKIDADPFEYDEVGNRCKERIKDLDFDEQLYQFEKFLYSINGMYS